MKSVSNSFPSYAQRKNLCEIVRMSDAHIDFSSAVCSSEEEKLVFHPRLRSLTDTLKHATRERIANAFSDPARKGLTVVK